MEKKRKKRKLITEFLNMDKFKLDENYVENFRMYTISLNPNSDVNILYFHGGAYVCEAAYMHTRMLESLVEKLGCKITYLDYPLAPEYDALTCRRICLKAYKELHRLYPNDKIVLMGDSAGGGLALAVRELIRDLNILPKPFKTVLCSPWLDVSFTYSKYDDYDKKDIFLSRETLTKAGLKYARDLDTKNPFVSPIYSSMENLGDIYICCSDNELFFPDCVKLNYRLDSKGTKFQLHIEKGYMHDYILLFRQKKVQITYDEIKHFLELV